VGAPLTAFDAGGLVVGERRIPFLCGAMHYWRLDPRRWEACLRAVVDLGLPLVETYVPWSVHETAAGGHDWTGARDLGRFVDLAGEIGLGVVLRVGPHCNAELTGFGYPDRVLRDADVLARAAHGGPVWMPAPPRAFPVPSYASARFRAEVGAWYRAIADVIAPRLAPAGPVVALQVDNEAQLFFRVGAYDHDYHPDAVAWWHASGGDGEPPRRWDPADAERCVAWVRFKERYVAQALGELTALLDTAGLGGVARFHNLPPGEPQWFDLPGVARAIGGPCGLDVYAGRRDLAAVKRRALYLVGSADPLPIAPEVGVGFVPWLPPITDDAGEQRDVALALVGCGVRGLSFYMAVGRDRWYDAAITPDGAPGPAAPWIRRVAAALDDLAWTSLRRAADVAVVVSRADARFGLASSWLDPVSPIVGEALGLGPGGSAELGRDDAAIAQRRWLTVVQDALDHARVPYVLVDEGCAADRLAAFRAVIVPTLGRIDAGLAATLREVAARHRIVVIGPDAPDRDELGRPLAAALPRRIGRMRAGSLDDVPGLAADLAAVAPPAAGWSVARGAADVMTLVDRAGEVRAAVVIHRGARAGRVEVDTPGAVVAHDAITGETVRGGDAGVTIPVAPRGVRMFVVE
jgi:beta-galactosidase